MNHYDVQSTLPLQKSFVGGAYIDSTSGGSFETWHPGNDQVICEEKRQDRLKWMRPSPPPAPP